MSALLAFYSLPRLSCLLITYEVDTVLRILFKGKRIGVSHVAGLPKVKETLSILQQLWIPVDVKTVKPLQYRFPVNPEYTFVFRKIIITERLLELWSPSLMVSVSEFSIPSEVPPWVLDEKYAEAHHLLHLKHSICMVTN